VRGVEDWPGACDALWDYAKRCGAMYLPEEAIDGLWDWMSATLIEEIDSQKAELSTMASDGL
jgi:hypothetical protein